MRSRVIRQYIPLREQGTVVEIGNFRCFWLKLCIRRLRALSKRMAALLLADLEDQRLYIAACSESSNGGPDPTQDIPRTPVTQEEMRRSIRNDFPISVQYRRLINGVEHFCSIQESRQAFRRLRDHTAAYNDLHSWGVGQPAQSCTPCAAVMFWFHDAVGGEGPVEALPPIVTFQFVQMLPSVV